MPRNTSSLIRNIALTGHNGSGKTTLVEQILFRAGVIHGRMGTIEEMGHLALFLATEDSSFLTGQAIEAEGGASLDY